MKISVNRWLAAALLTAILPMAAHGANNPASLSVADANAFWARVLNRFVDNEGRVDYHALSEDRADLDRYIGWVGAVSPASHSERFRTREAVLAYHINAYNALAMHAILESKLPRSIGGLSKILFFGVHRIRVGGDGTTLYAYENDIIRPLGDPRIHFALNCMALSCPKLPRVPFEADTIDKMLDRETRRFFSEQRNLIVNHDTRTVTLSEILDFFTEDFVDKNTTLIDFVNRYVDKPIPRDFAVRFFKYDWRVNFQPAS